MTQTLTTDRLKQITDAISAEPHDYESIYDSIKHGEIAAMARELLANREARPVAYIGAQMLEDLTDGARGCGRVWASYKDVLSGDGRLALYTAPPAPAVPDELVEEHGTWKTPDVVFGWNACRAAMLAAAPEGGK